MCSSMFFVNIRWWYRSVHSDIRYWSHVNSKAKKNVDSKKNNKKKTIICDPKSDTDLINYNSPQSEDSFCNSCNFSITYSSECILQEPFKSWNSGWNLCLCHYHILTNLLAFTHEFPNEPVNPEFSGLHVYFDCVLNLMMGYWWFVHVGQFKTTLESDIEYMQ